MIPTDRFYELAAILRDEVVARWPADAQPLPERQLVHTGFLPVDEPAFAVCVTRIFGTVGDPAFEQFASRVTDVWYLRAMAFDLTIDRPAATFDVQGDQEVRTPPAAVIEAEAQERLQDAAALTRCVIEADEAYAFGRSIPVAFEGWTPRGPEGGIAGGSFGVRIGLT